MPLIKFGNTEAGQDFITVSPLTFVKLLFSHESHDISWRLSPMRQGGGVPVWGRAMRKAPFLGWVLTGVGAEPGGRVQSPGRPGGAGGRGGLSASDSGAGCREMGEAAGKAVPGPPSSPQGQAAHSPGRPGHSPHGRDAGMWPLS